MVNVNDTQLLLRIAEALEGGSQATPTSSVQAPLTPQIEIVTSSGTIAPGAKFISIGILQGSGTILGTPVDVSIEAIELPYVPQGYQEINYTLAADSKFIIVYGV